MRVLWLTNAPDTDPAEMIDRDFYLRSLISVESIEKEVLGVSHLNNEWNNFQKKLAFSMSEFKPDIIIYVGSQLGSEHILSGSLLLFLKQQCKTILLCPEASDSVWWYSLLTEYHERKVFDLIVNLDGNDEWPYSEHHLTKIGPFNDSMFQEYVPWSERKNLIGFSGSVDHPLRQYYIYRILGQKIVLHDKGEDNFTYQDYVDFYKKCKIAFNTPYNCNAGGVVTRLEDNAHLKHRVIETAMAGCLVLEGENRVTPRWFTPGEDYVEYRNPRELLEILGKIKHDGKYEEMAMSMRQKCLREHNAEVFWKDVFSRIG
jgi:hypothetical protein